MEGSFPVVWTEFAENQLDDIFEYFLAVSGFDPAQKLVQKLIIATKVLELQPEVGQIEQALLNRKEQVRYLVEGNFKILYFLRDGMVIISDVFDTRQSPKRLKRSL
ncbi:type II toxin-antitoxin system RelE/ParE family toxin [Algoriphagus sp.]|jgi:plasmid stabilization system protein ParE|uniref:type II toxin-antitoxin system RelE/ParE family toxin n=1 Tax=Algoriphagus sp. TaxID=1872435 RepID=UPI00271C3E57|nr:type II toxin-antitoxin system RelE/ParE family toxin [Algoriphagus sp.]MDO8965979.1 type II toxin-antitoxin system RelE/ParE family toxin [Algoriphagus sp.]MDP3198505.1 type II toxin-antitoxin system RelE/ParE family toxin [Algoriphagus sp.]